MYSGFKIRTLLYGDRIGWSSTVLGWNSNFDTSQSRAKLPRQQKVVIAHKYFLRRYQWNPCYMGHVRGVRWDGTKSHRRSTISCVQYAFETILAHLIFLEKIFRKNNNGTKNDNGTLSDRIQSLMIHRWFRNDSYVFEFYPKVCHYRFFVPLLFFRNIFSGNIRCANIVSNAYWTHDIELLRWLFVPSHLTPRNINLKIPLAFPAYTPVLDIFNFVFFETIFNSG